MENENKLKCCVCGCVVIIPCRWLNKKPICAKDKKKINKLVKDL